MTLRIIPAGLSAVVTRVIGRDDAFDIMVVTGGDVSGLWVAVVELIRVAGVDDTPCVVLEGASVYSFESLYRLRKKLRIEMLSFGRM